MALIDEKTRDFLQTKFAAELVRPITVELFHGAGNPETVAFARDLVQELGELTDKISLQVKPLEGEEAQQLGLQASPTLLLGRELGYRIEYWGAPLGMEAEGFIDTLVLASRGEPGLQAMSESLLKLLDREVRLYSFVTPTCPYCPKAVLQNHRLALGAPGQVRSICVEAQQNMDLARKFRVSSVPQQLFDEDPATVSVGVQPEKTYLRNVLRHAGVADAALDALEQEAKQSQQQLPARPDKPVHVTDGNFSAAITQYPFLIVDCWAEWCGPCRMLGPVVEALAGELQGKVVFGKLDTEENPETSQEYAIHSIPTMLVFSKGKLVERLVGFKPKPALKKEIEALLAKHG